MNVKPLKMRVGSETRAECLGVLHGESSTGWFVQILSKFSVEEEDWIFGLKGLCTSPFSSFVQLIDLKKGCFLTASDPCGPDPSLFVGSFVKSALMSDWASVEMNLGNFGLEVRI